MVVLMLIYKIISKALWQEAEKTGVFLGAPVDLADGFIHFSTGAQVQETARRHFRGQDNLLLLSLDDHSLGDALVWGAFLLEDGFLYIGCKSESLTISKIKPAGKREMEVKAWFNGVRTTAGDVFE